MFSGHHNLAWQLNDDPRFEPSLGDVNALREEIASAGHSTVILSSEDFEYLYCRPERMSVVKSLADSLGYDAYVVVFFREWASYANSLYAELIKYGLTQSVEEFVDGIILQGEFVAPAGWRFCFDYSRIVAGFQGVFGADRVLWRAYGKGTVEQFFHTVGLDEFHAQLSGEYTANESIGPSAVEALLALNRQADREGMPLDEVSERRDRILAEASGRDAGVKFGGISGVLKDRLDNRFVSARRWLYGEEGLPKRGRRVRRRFPR